jgi:hypothetical protein
MSNSFISNSKYFRKIGYSLALILSLSFLLDSLTDYFYKKNSYHKFRQIFDQKASDIDIAIFGSSVAKVHFDDVLISKRMGNTTFNFGEDGIFFQQNMGLLDSYLNHAKEGSRIIIAASFAIFTHRDIETRPDLFLAYLSNPEIYEMLRTFDHMKWAKAKWLPGYKLTMKEWSFYKVVASPLLKAESDMDDSGFEPQNKRWEETEIPEINNSEINNLLVLKLSAMINKCKQKDIEVILVMPPVYRSGKFDINTLDSINLKLEEIALKEGANFYNYTDSLICNKKEYFYNYMHMNSMGAQEFSMNFIEHVLKVSE